MNEIHEDTPEPNRLVKALPFLAVCFGYVMLGALIAALILPKGAVEFETSYHLFAFEVVLTGLTIWIVWAALRSREQSLGDIGLSLKPNLLQILAEGTTLGFVVKVASVPIGILAYLLGAEGGPPEMELDGPLGILAGICGGALAGVHEEIFFRGYARIRVAELLRDPVPGGGLLCTGLPISLCFGLLHGYQGVAGILVTTVVGLCFFAITTSRRYTLWHAIVAHAVFNAISFALLAAIE